MTTTAITNPAPADFATTTLQTDSGSLATPCEPINDWLAITPEIGMDEDGKSWLLGGFTVTHRQTGADLVEGPGCIECCRLAGKALAALDVDWSALTRDNGQAWFDALPDETKRAYADIRPVEWACDAEPCERGDAEAA